MHWQTDLPSGAGCGTRSRFFIKRILWGVLNQDSPRLRPEMWDQIHPMLMDSGEFIDWIELAPGVRQNCWAKKDHWVEKMPLRWREGMQAALPRGRFRKGESELQCIAAEGADVFKQKVKPIRARQSSSWSSLLQVGAGSNGSSASTSASVLKSVEALFSMDKAASDADADADAAAQRAEEKAQQEQVQQQLVATQQDQLDQMESAQQQTWQDQQNTRSQENEDGEQVSVDIASPSA